MNRLHRAVRDAGNKPLLGAALYFYDPIFLEIAIRLGYDVIWIEMEHAPITFAEAADLCRMAAGSSVLTMIRIPDTRRESVLQAAECGPDIIDVPMINHPEQLKDLVSYSKFAPEGARGFFSVSRAVNYGVVANVPDAQQQLNRELCLMAQIETIEAVQRIDELCAVPGVDIFIGPADLAASLGVPGETTHPKVLAAARQVIQTAKHNERKVATACAVADADHWLGMGVDLLFCTNDIVCLRSGARQALEQAHSSIERIAHQVE